MAMEGANWHWGDRFANWLWASIATAPAKKYWPVVFFRRKSNCKYQQANW